MTARDEAIEAAARGVVVQGRGEIDTLRVGRLRARAALDAAVPVLLNDLADRIDKEAADEETDPAIIAYHGADYWRGVTAGKFRAVDVIRRAAAEGWGAD